MDGIDDLEKCHFFGVEGRNLIAVRSGNSNCGLLDLGMGAGARLPLPGPCACGTKLKWWSNHQAVSVSFSSVSSVLLGPGRLERNEVGY